MSILMSERPRARTLISDQLFDRLVNRIVVDEQLNRELASRIMEQALAFLAACAHNHGAPLAPSEQVDIGWHTFILYTRDYAEFCQREAGRFLHHIPTDDVTDTAPCHAGHATFARTVAAIEAAGFTVDEQLWPALTHKCNQQKCNQACTQCHQGCTDSPHH